MLMGAIACTAMIMRFVMSIRSGNIRETAAQKLNCGLAHTALCVCLNVCYPMCVCYMYAGSIRSPAQYNRWNGKACLCRFYQYMVLSETRWGRCVWLCVHPNLGNWCYVSCPWRQPLSLCLTLSVYFSLARSLWWQLTGLTQWSVWLCLAVRDNHSFHSFPVSSPLPFSPLMIKN